MPPNRFESEVESFLEGSHGDRTHIKRADHPRLHHYAGRYSSMKALPKKERKYRCTQGNNSGAPRLYESPYEIVGKMRSSRAPLTKRTRLNESPSEMEGKSR